MVEARKVEPGQLVVAHTGDVVKVLNSNPERLSAASASASKWEICAYAEGKPTLRIMGGPSTEVEVVEKKAAW